MVARVQTHLKLNKIRFNAAKQIELANKARDHLAILSHELRTPLTPALLLAESLATNNSVPIKVKKNYYLFILFYIFIILFICIFYFIFLLYYLFVYFI